MIKEDKPMECYETTTATGEGFWGKPHHFKLIRRQRQYTSRYNQQQRELIDYGLYFQEPVASHWDLRLFGSEEERTTFITRSISDLRLTSLSKAHTIKAENFLAGLIGKRLSSVTFIMDYVQMDFNGHQFNFYNWPVLHEGQTLFNHQKDRYSDKLTGLIGKTIKAADEYLDIGLSLEFESGPLLSIPLRMEENHSISEIAEYHRPDQHWMVWSVGQAPFE
jgi:hypothetical protein